MRNKRIVVTRYGGPEVLAVLEEDVPEPGPGEVRVKVQAAGVSLPDILAREGVHPETPLTPFTPGWDLVGLVERLGAGVASVKPGDVVAAMPIHGAYAEFICLPESELVPVPPGLEPAEAVSVVLNYITAYQMLHRTAKVSAGQRVLIHGATGGVGTAFLQLGQLAKLEMFGTCSARGAALLSGYGCVWIDYKQQDFVAEIRRLTGDGVDAVFDPVGGSHLWRSRKALRRNGRVVGYGLSTALRGAGLTAAHPGRRQRYRGTPKFAFYIAAAWLLPGRKRILPYSIQTLKRLKPAMFREDLVTLLELLRQRKIQPVIARTFALDEARQAQEMLAAGGVNGKFVLMCNA